MVLVFCFGRHDEITDAISVLMDSEFKVVPHRVEDSWKDTGRHEDAIFESNHFMLDWIELLKTGKVEDGATVVDRVRIGKSLIGMGQSVVRGSLETGEGRKSGPNACMGSYATVGDRCQISFGGGR